MTQSSKDHLFTRNQQTGWWMLIAMAATVVAFALAVVTILPNSTGLEIAPLDAQEMTAQYESSSK